LRLEGGGGGGKRLLLSRGRGRGRGGNEAYNVPRKVFTKHVALVQHEVDLLPLRLLLLLLLGRPHLVRLVAVVCEAVVFVDLCKVLSGEDGSAKVKVDECVRLCITPRLLFFCSSFCRFENGAGGGV